MTQYFFHFVGEGHVYVDTAGQSFSNLISAKAYAARLADFGKLGATVVGISYDPLDVLKRFQAEENAPQRFVSDPQGEAINAFGVSLTSQGEQYAKRATFVIRDGKVLHVVFEWSPLANVNKTLDWLTAHQQQ